MNFFSTEILTCEIHCVEICGKYRMTTPKKYTKQFGTHSHQFLRSTPKAIASPTFYPSSDALCLSFAVLDAMSRLLLYRGAENDLTYSDMSSKLTPAPSVQLVFPNTQMNTHEVPYDFFMRKIMSTERLRDVLHRKC